MVDTRRKEELAKSYLNALCAVKGISMEIQMHDDDSLDVMLKKIVIRSDTKKYNAQISVQLKSSSSNYTEHETYYSYPLPKKNFDELRLPATAKAFLFVLILPAEEKDWIGQSISELIMRQCMYWLDLKGMPDSPNSTNVTVHLPRTNVVSPETLDRILVGIAEEVLL